MFAKHCPCTGCKLSCDCLLLANQGPDEQESMYETPPYWRAPELLKNAPHSRATDVYAFGMLLYEVLFRRDPFAGESSEVRQHASIPILKHPEPVSQTLHGTACNRLRACNRVRHRYPSVFAQQAQHPPPAHTDKSFLNQACSTTVSYCKGMQSMPHSMSCIHSFYRP